MTGSLEAEPTERGASPQAEHAQASEALLEDLPAELLALVVGALPPDDELAAALSCRRLHAAVACVRLRDGRAGSTTSAVSALSSVEKVNCGRYRAACRSVTRLDPLCAHAQPKGGSSKCSAACARTAACMV
jgi:hypothetical protein